MNYDIGLNAIPSLQNDITYGLSKQLLQNILMNP